MGEARAMNRTPVAFMSYVRMDDEHEQGRLTQFCERLSGEVRMQTGEAFEIFLDRKNIAWGQEWKARTNDQLDQVTFLIAIITPAFFKSKECRAELERFLAREERLNRADLVLPLYYVESATLSDEAKREKDDLARAIAGRQHADWRELRFEPFTSPEIGKRLAKMARQIVEALERNQPAPPPAPPIPAASAAGRSGPSDPGQTGQSVEGTQGGTTSAAPGPVPKPALPTLVVDALHRGDHPTIGDAMRAAIPGTRILVRPGLYQESVVIDKPVEIVGDGALGDVVIEAEGSNVIRFQTTMGRVANVTLRQRGGGEWYAVDIPQGRLDLEGCDISSESLSCVGIHAGADPRLRRNLIHDGTQGGVLVYEDGAGTLEDNEIFGNMFSGVEVRTEGHLTLRRNRIFDGKGSGVLVHDGGHCTIEDNDVFGNALAGVQVGLGGHAILRRNRVHDGKQGGVFVNENGAATLEGNEVFRNGFAGVQIQGNSQVTLRRNKVYDGKQSGVFVNDGGSATLEENEISGNGFAGVDVTTGGNPIARHNKICRNKGSGVYVYQDGQGTFEDNEILENVFAGVSSESGGAPTVRGNTIAKNGYEAIWVAVGGAGVFENNDLRENARGAWDIHPESTSKVTNTGNREE